jgi:septal ring factor EnvC (AmiA/AmiB activator)
VVFAGPFRRYNHIVIIGHGRGWTSLITNLGTLQVQVGQQVIAGSPIGRAAAGGRGITVELRHGGQPVDITRFVE